MRQGSGYQAHGSVAFGTALDVADGSLILQFSELHAIRPLESFRSFRSVECRTRRLWNSQKRLFPPQLDCRVDLVQQIRVQRGDSRLVDSEFYTRGRHGKAGVTNPLCRSVCDIPQWLPRLYELVGAHVRSRGLWPHSLGKVVWEAGSTFDSEPQNSFNCFFDCALGVRSHIADHTRGDFPISQIPL